jgi:peptidoglycan/LPS O-acetylase OafA/YrhL
MASAIIQGAAVELQTEQRRFYLPELDSLRFFAFFSVFCHHLARELGIFAIIPYIGIFGVDLFFTLSAYLITELLIREKEQFGILDVQAFYVRRILRIWPLYFAFLSVSFIFLTIYPIIQTPPAYLAFFAIFLGNFALGGWSNPPANSLAINTLWSVSVEEQFY